MARISGEQDKLHQHLLPDFHKEETSEGPKATQKKKGGTQLLARSIDYFI